MVPWHPGTQHAHVESLSRILLVVERDQRVHAGIAKALMLARHTHACLELFLCDCITGGGEERRQHSAREYLRSLRQGIVASDVCIDLHAACEHSLWRAVTGRLRREPAQLVVRTHGERAAMSGTPVVLTRGRPWQPTPRFMTALLINSRGDQTPRATRGPATWLPEMLGRRCGAHVDYVVAAAEVLPTIITGRDYDLITMTLRGTNGSRQDAAASSLADLSHTSADVLFVAAVGSTGAAAYADAREVART
jgi:hypothetical protein